MLRQFHKKMTLLYTLTTGIILTCVLFIILTYNEKLMKLRDEEAFQSCIWTIVTTLNAEQPLSHSWLANMEAENDLIIHIEENGLPLLYKGSWTPDTKRDILIQKAKQFAEQNNINTSDALLSSDMQKSEIFQLKGDVNDNYQGIVIKLRSDNNYVNLILIHSMQPLKSGLLKQRCLFVLLGITGILALFFVSWIFVKKSLRPIQENRKKQDEFFAAASHELRSPIAVIQASANAITADPAKTSHLISNILSECHRLSRLTEDMLTLSRTNAPGWSANMATLDMDTLLLETFETFEPICKENKLSLTLTMPETSLPSVMGDYERLQQLLAILLDNAISHSSAKTDNRIEIIAQSYKHKIEIQIADHGVGIPDSQKELIFDHFYCKDASRGEKSHFGLGLGIAAELTKLHRGRLTIMDTKGGGATFKLTLPS